MTISSGLATAREPATANLAFGRDSSRGMGKLGSGEKGAFRRAQVRGSWRREAVGGPKRSKVFHVIGSCANTASSPRSSAGSAEKTENFSVVT